MSPDSRSVITGSACECWATMARIDATLELAKTFSTSLNISIVMDQMVQSESPQTASLEPLIPIRKRRPEMGESTPIRQRNHCI